MERFAQFVSQLLLSALSEVMPDTAITTATVCVCVSGGLSGSVCANQIFVVRTLDRLDG